MKRTRVPDWLRKMASVAVTIPGFTYLFRGPYRKFLNRIQANRNEVFRKNALGVLKDFDEAFISNGIMYSVFAGTLLGAIREKGFIKHDLDIDCVIFHEDYSDNIEKILIKKGFSRLHTFSVDNGQKGLEETYVKNGVSIDLFQIYSDADFPTYQCDFHRLPEEENKKYPQLRAVRRIQFPISKEVIRVPFESIEVNVIKNYDEWLKARYGDDYMIPNPNFHDIGDNPGIREWTEVRANYIKY